MKCQNLTGQRFGRLTVVEDAGRNKQGGVNWLCICDCGKTVKVSQSNLHRSAKGENISCGCFKAESGRKQFTTHGLSRDDGEQSRLYGIWNDMRRRCMDQKRKAFKDYGGRGITVYPEWMNFESFYFWAVGNGYSNDLTLDRIDSNGNYEPSNCRWATMKEQNNNKRSNRVIEYNGRSKTLTKWAEEQGMQVGTLWGRLKKGWPMEKALTTPIRRAAA